MSRVVAPLRTLVVLLVVLTAACGGGSDPTLDTSNGPIIVGSGEVPPGFPDDFPIPGDAVIGSTLIDTVGFRSEMSLQIPAEMNAAVQFFSLGLVNEGYVVESSTGSETSWTIEFSKGELEGTVVVVPIQETSQAVATVNQI
jgi:hypothetical protein